jgi:hypothetical protein
VDYLLVVEFWSQMVVALSGLVDLPVHLFDTEFLLVWKCKTVKVIELQ